MNRSAVLLVLPAVILTGVISAGCESDDGQAVNDRATTSTVATPSITADVPHNDADVAFLQGMYPHHAQAIAMSEMAEGRTDNPDLLALAARIEAAQAPEMDQMVALLDQFGEPGPMGPGAMGEHMGDDGMLSPGQMHALLSAEGAEFDRLWLEGMIAHHEGAIEMSNTVIAEGSNPDVRAMAESIIQTQRTEIDQMRTMLGQ